MELRDIVFDSCSFRLTATNEGEDGERDMQLE